MTTLQVEWRDLAEMFLVRVVEFTHETIRDWERRITVLVTEQLRSRHAGKARWTWFADETYVKMNWKWCYLNRAIDGEGNLVDPMLSEHRDM